MRDPGTFEETRLAHLYPEMYHVKFMTIHCVIKQQFKRKCLFLLSKKLQLYHPYFLKTERKY